MLNASHSFNAEPASFIMGLHELIVGRTPRIGPPFTFLGVPFGSIADNILAILTVLSLTIGVVGTVRARRWGARRANATAWLTIARCVPYAMLAFVPAILPSLLAVVNRGATVPWSVIVAVWPPLPILIVVSALAGAAVVVWRSIQVWKRRTARGSVHRLNAQAAS